MILTILNILQIALICVLVTDFTDFFENIEKWIARWLGVNNVSLKILECSLCQTWWCSLLYLIITNNVSITTILIALSMAVATPILMNTVLLIRESLISLTNWFLKNVS